MTTILSYALAAAIAVAALASFWAWTERTSAVAARSERDSYKSRYETAERARRVARDAQWRAEQRAKALRLETEEARKVLERELSESAAEWAAQEVPEAVRRALK